MVNETQNRISMGRDVHSMNEGSYSKDFNVEKKGYDKQLNDKSRFSSSVNVPISLQIDLILWV